MKTTAILTALFVAAAMIAFAQPSSPSVQEGRKLFTAYGCYQCHGREAQGASTGPRLARHPGPVAAFTAYLRRPTADMPPYTAKVLPDKDAADIYAFVKSIPPPKTPADLPLLSSQPPASRH